MKNLAFKSVTTAAGLAALVFMATPVAAHGPTEGAGPGMRMMGPGMMMAQSQGAGENAPQAPAPGYGMGPGMMGAGYGYGPGMMGPGMGYGMGPRMMMGPGYGYGPSMMMGPGMGYGMGPGMMGPGMGYGMMGPAMGYGMGPGMMHSMMHGGGMGYGPGMGYGMPCWQQGAATVEDLGPDDVKARMGRWLAMQGNDRLKLGKIETVDDDTITVEIVTVDDSLVRKLAVDRHSGWTRPAQ